MKKIVALLLICVLACGIFNVQSAQAAENSLSVEIYTKQTRQLTLFYNSKAVAPSNVTWKVTKGTDKVKVGKDGLLTGKKKGKAVVTATYKSTSFTYNVTVKKAPKAKAKTYKVNGVSVKIPKGFVKNTTIETGDNMTALQYVKDDSQLVIAAESLGVNLGDLSDADYDGLRTSVESTFAENIDTMLTTTKQSMTESGFEIKKVKSLKQEGLKRGYLALITAEIKTEPAIYILNIYSFVGEKMVQITISTTSKKFAESTANTIIKNNKYN